MNQGLLGEFTRVLYLYQLNRITLGHYRSTVVEHAHQRIEQLSLTLEIRAGGILADRPRRAIAFAEFIEKFKTTVLKHIGPITAAEQRNTKRVFRAGHMPCQHKLIGIHLDAIGRLVLCQQAHLIVEIKRGSTTRQVNNRRRQ